MTRTAKNKIDINLLNQRKLYSPEEVGVLLGICRSKVYVMLRKQTLASVLVEGMRKVRRVELDRYLAKLGEEG
jgi:excisionase family DNA binding protein